MFRALIPVSKGKFPGNFESTNLSRDNLSRGLGRSLTSRRLDRNELVTILRRATAMPRTRPRTSARGASPVRTGPDRTGQDTPAGPDRPRKVLRMVMSTLKDTRACKIMFCSTLKSKSAIFCKLSSLSCRTGHQQAPSRLRGLACLGGLASARSRLTLEMLARVDLNARPAFHLSPMK